MLSEPADRILPGAAGTIVAISVSGRAIQLLDAATGAPRASLQLRGEPVSFALHEIAPGIQEFAVVTRGDLTSVAGPYALDVFSITGEGFQPHWSREDAVPQEFGQPAVRFVVLPDSERALVIAAAVVVWERATDSKASLYRIVGQESTNEVIAKLYPYELLNIGSDQFMLALHPFEDGASLADLLGGYPRDEIFVEGLSFKDPSSFATFVPDAARGGTGDAIIANAEAELLTILSVQKDARLPRIASPVQISFKNHAAFRAGNRRLLLAAERDLSFVVLGAMGSAQLAVFRTIKGALEKIERPIDLGMPIRDLAVLNKPTGAGPETFVFLREDGREVLAIADIRTMLEERQPPHEVTTIAFTSAQLDAADSARLQRVLTALGHPVGAIDGVIGANTKAAIRAFQFAMKLKPTGLIDQPTIDALNVAVGKIQTVAGLDTEYYNDYRAFLEEQVPGVRASRLLTMGVSHENPDSSCFGLNSLPPRKLWANSVGFARILKRLEADFKLKVEIVSGYRSEEYSRCVPGSQGSTHRLFQGFDIRLEDAETFEESTKRLLEVLTRMRDAGEFKGGLGSLARSVHVDTRGTNATFGLFSE